MINRSALFSAILACAVCLVMTLLFLSSLIELYVAITVGAAFFVSMLLLMGPLVTSIAEVRLAICLLYVLCLLDVIFLLNV